MLVITEVKTSMTEQYTGEEQPKVHILFFAAIIYVVVKLVKEALEKPAPKGQRFDWDVYWQDVNNGMDAMEQVRKRQRGGYLTTEPLPSSNAQTVISATSINREAEQTELEAQRRKLEEDKRCFEAEREKRQEEKARAEAERKRLQEEKENLQRMHIKEVKKQCIQIIEGYGLSDIKVIIPVYGSIEMSGILNNVEYKLTFSPALYRHQFPNDAALIILAKSLCEIDFLDKYNRERKIQDFYSKYGYGILEIKGCYGNDPIVFVQGLCSASDTVMYHFDIAESNESQNNILDSHSSSELQPLVENVRDAKPATAELIDSMDGLQFERYCADLLEKNGYENVSVTSGSGDQGVDVIAYRDGIKYGIQCKCYSSTIGNRAVQEVFTGKTFYQCHVGIVLTNNYFTPAAIELAQRSGIILWNRDKLLQLIENADI